MPVDIPIIDLAPWYEGDQPARLGLCRQLGKVCHQTGFFYLVNHRIPRNVSEAYLAVLKAFFELPLAQRRALDKRHSPQFRGWEQLGSELTNNARDMREQIDIGVEAEALIDPQPYYMALIGPNQWPEESSLPGFRRTVEDYFARLANLSGELLGMMSLALGLEEKQILQSFGAKPAPYLKLIRYPQTGKQEQGVGVHKDSGFLTLLLQDENPGLEALSNQGQWYSVDPLPGSLVVNTGELLQLITHNYFIATPHRVINKNSQQRYSSAFFFSPDLNTRLDPLPVSREILETVGASARHRDEGLMASRSEMASGTEAMASRDRPRVFGERYWQRWIRSYPEIARNYYPQWLD